VYPGATPQATYSAQTADSTTGNFSMKTPDSITQVLGFYQDKFKSAGLQTMISQSDQGGLVRAEDSANNRSVVVTATPGADGTQVTITSAEKKH